MALTENASGLRVQNWDRDFNREYIQSNIFKSSYGKDKNAVIWLREDATKKPGDSITLAMVNRATNAATTGTNTLKGNEEAISSRSMRIYVDKRRNAFNVAEMSEVKSAISLREAGKDAMLDWALEDTIDQIVIAFGSLNGTAFLSRTATIADAWLVDNADRTVFGAYSAQGSAGGTDLSADLAQLDTTNDLFNVTALDKMILAAKTCSPKIKPMLDKSNGRRFYIAYANPHAMKNLRDSIDTEVLATTVIEGQAMKLFEGGDIFWNGCIVKEVDAIPIYANIGNGSTVEVTPVYLCGAGAVCVAFGKAWHTITDEDDYKDKYGVAVEAIYGVRKIIFGTGTGDTDDTKDNGVVTGFFATTGTATETSAAEV